MSLNVNSQNLVLSVSDISSSDVLGDYPLSNNMGSINSDRTLCTWYNIDIKQILGQNYYNYSIFGLKLNCIQVSTSDWGLNASDRLINLRLQGLPVLSNSYDYQFKTNTSYSVIGGAYITYNTINNFIYPQNTNILNFQKCENVNISIQMVRADGTTLNVGAASLAPRIEYIFSVYGIK